MNEEYLLGAYNSFGGQEVLKTDFNTWVSKIKDNEEYKQGMFDNFGGQETLQADYATWNIKVFGEVKKKGDSQLPSQNKDVVSNGDTTNAVTSSDSQEPKLPDTVSAPDNTIGIQEPVKLDKETFRNKVSNGFVSDDVKQITANPKAYKDTFLKQRDLFNADQLPLMLNHITELKKTVDNTGVQEGKLAIQQKLYEEKGKIKQFELQRIKSENEYTKDIQNRIEQNGGDVSYLTPKEIQDLHLDIGFVKTDAFKIDGKNTSANELVNKLKIDDGFVSSLRDGKIKIDFNENANLVKNNVLTKDQFNVIKELANHQKNSYDKTSEFVIGRINNVLELVNGVLKIPNAVATLITGDNRKSPTDLVEKISSGIASVTETLNIPMQTRGQSALEDFKTGKIGVGLFRYTEDLADLAPIIALTSTTGGVGTGVILGTSAAGNKADSLLKERHIANQKQEKGFNLSEKEQNALKYTNGQIAANAGLIGGVNALAMMSLGKYFGRLAGVNTILKDEGINALIKEGKKTLAKRFTKGIIENAKFTVGLPTAEHIINLATDIKDDNTFLDILKEGTAKALFFSAALAPGEHIKARNNMVEGINDYLGNTLVDKNQQTLSEEITHLQNAKKNEGLPDESKALIDKSIEDKITQYNEVTDTQSKFIRDIPLDTKIEFVKRHDEIIKSQQTIKTIGKDSEAGKILQKEINKKSEKYVSDLNNAINPSAQETNKQYTSLVKEAQNVGTDTTKGQELVKEAEKIKEEFKTVTNEIKNTEKTKINEVLPKQDKKEKDVVYNEDKNIITDAIDNKEVYVYDGKKGTITTDGQQVIFESGKDIFELGNKDELSSATLDKFGITKDATRPIIDNNNNVTIDGKKYLNNYNNPESAITKTKDGYTVTLETETGEKRNFRGAKADEIVYQYKLKKAKENETELTTRIEEAHRIADEAIATQNKIRESAPKRATKSIRKGEPVKLKEKDLFSETQKKGDTKPNADLQPKVEPSVPKGENKDIQPTVKPTASKGKIKVEIRIFEDVAENKLANEKLTEKNDPKQESDVKAIESESKITESLTEPKTEKLTKRVGRKIDQALDIEVKKVSDISTDENRFQGRKGLNEDIVNDIALNWSDANQDPIHIWKDPKDGKTYVLSGHHRLAAAELVGRTDVKIIDRSADFTEKQAIKFATEDANANRTMETPLERAETLRKKRENGDSKDDINDFLKREGRNKTFIENLSFLNPKGLVIQVLEAFNKTTDKQNSNEIEKYADWVGNARKKNKQLTDSHEKELFDFLNNKESSKRFTNKADFLSKVNSITESMFFKPEDPLNIARFKNKTEGEKEYDKDVQEQKTVISDLESKRDNIKDRLNNPSNPDYINPNASDYKDIVDRSNKIIQDFENNLKIARAKLLEIYQDKGKYQRSGLNQESLFGETSINDVEKFDLSKKSGIDSATKWVNDISTKLDKFGNENLSMGLPIVVAKIMVKAMKVALKTAKTGADLISAGVNAVKATDWYKNLNEQERKNLIELKVKSTDVFSIVQKELKTEIKKGELRSERLKQTTVKLRQKHKDLKTFQIEIVKHIREKLDAEDIPSLTKSKVTQMMRKIVGMNEKSTKRVLNEVDYIISDAKYKTAVNKVLKVLKTPKDYIEKVNGRPKAKGIDNNARKALQLMQEHFNLSANDIQTKINEASANPQDFTFEDYHALNIALDIAKAREVNGEAETLKSERYLKVTNVKDADANRKINQQKSDNQTFLKDEAWRKMNGVINEVVGFIGNGKSALKDQLLAEHTRLKEITEFATEDTNFELSGLSILEIQNRNFEKKTNILTRMFGKTDSKNEKFRLIPTTVNTFEFLLNYLNRNNDSGTGRMYEHFYKGENGIVKSDGDFKRAKEELFNKIDSKINEVLGVSFVKFYSDIKHQREINKVKKSGVTLLNEDGTRSDQPLSIGQALNAHLVLKMEDAREKLSNQGWDNTSHNQLEAFLGEKYLKISDFMTEIIASEKDKYKSKFLEINRTDMGDIPNYFPTKIEGIDLIHEVNLGESTFAMPSVNSPHTIDRVQHTKRIDISRNAFEVMDEYFDSMEKFYNYARITKDLNAMLSNSNFRNNVKTYDSHAFNDLTNLSKAVIGDERAITAEKFEQKIYTWNAAVAAGYITGKVFTAFKQIVSLGAYAEFADSKSINGIRVPLAGKIEFAGKSIFNLNPISIYKNYKFFQKNSDHFRNRIKRNSIGDEFIQSFLQRKNSNIMNTIIKKTVKLGIKPNVLMDAITIASGGKVYYDQQFKKYSKVMGKPEAHKLAIRDFDISFKKTQQSPDFSELSPLQIRKGGLTAMFATFKNSQFSYLRRAVTNKNDIVNRFSRKKAFYKRLGNSDAKAGVKALKFVLKDGKTHNNIENLLIYTHALPLAWQFVASGLPGLLTSWNDDDTEEMKRALYLGPVDGVFALGDLTKFAYNTAVMGKSWELKSNILFDQISKSIKEMSKAYKDAGEFNEDVLLSIVKNGLITKSINVDTFKNVYDGIEGLFLEGDVTQENFMKVINATGELKGTNKKSSSKRERHKVKRKKVKRYN